MLTRADVDRKKRAMDARPRGQLVDFVRWLRDHDQIENLEQGLAVIEKPWNWWAEYEAYERHVEGIENEPRPGIEVHSSVSMGSSDGRPRDGGEA